MKNITNKIQLAFFIGASLSLIACSSGGGGGRWDNKDEFLKSMDRKHNTFYLAEVYKDPAARAGYKVYVFESGGNIKYGALNPNDPKRYTYNDPLDYWSNHLILLDPIGSGKFRGTDGNIYEKAVATQKDLEAMGALREELKISSMAETFQAEYGLSDRSRALEMAHLVHNYNAIRNRRSLTASELNSFTKDLTGMTYDQLEKELTEDLASAPKIIEEIARFNEMSVEGVNRVIREVTTGNYSN